MKANSIVFRHWDDVVFENRNKRYGAYSLRRAYEKRLLTGVGVTVAVVALLLSLQNIYSGEKIKEVVPPPLAGKGIILTEPPSILRRQPPRNLTRPPRTPATNRTVLVTRDEVIEDEAVEAITEYFSDDELGTGDAGTPEGLGTIPLAEPEPVAESKPIDFAEVMPTYEGGLEAMMKFIQKKIRYPHTPRQQGIDGTVYVRFVVNGDGSVSDVQILKGVHRDYDKEAIRVISMLPSWRGGSHNGRPVSVRMVLPIKFNLQK